ncbi:MAG: hypothetical protein ACK5JT_05740 [Hyphomicrobiaceae bacterium]
MFRFVLVPDDVVANVTIDGVVRYQPNTRAVFRHPDGGTSTVHINADGWNSTKDHYAVPRKPGVARIAVVGDSYVHEALIEPRNAFPAIVERGLNRAGSKAEVYRFGMDGAPLSQYLLMLRREVIRYRPDVVVVPIIHNDFDESWRQLSRRYSSSFLKIDTDAPGGPEEVPPVAFEPGLADVLRKSATFRYLYYKTNAYLKFKGLISHFFWGGDEVWSPQNIQSGVDIRLIGDERRNRVAVTYVLREMKKLAEQHDFKLLFLMDGVREAVYAGKPISDYAVGSLNKLAADITAREHLPFIDLTEAFRADWAKHHQHFEFPFDWHWNNRGNRIVADVILRAIRNDLGEKRVRVRSDDAQNAG